jgi:2-keto-3-deoxy-L-rhamnonate aldolase RhmA
MKRTPNAVRAVLAAGQAAIGSAVYSWSPNTMETAGYAGLDFVRLDCEHAWRQDGALDEMLRAAELVDPRLPLATPLAARAVPG